MFDVYLPSFIGLVASFGLLRSLTTGVASIGALKFEKEREPANYWGLTILHGVMAAGAFWMAFTD